MFFTPQYSDFLLHVAHEVLTRYHPPRGVVPPSEHGLWTSKSGYSIEEICDLWLFHILIELHYTSKDSLRPMFSTFVSQYTRPDFQDFPSYLERKPFAYEIAFDSAKREPNVIEFLLRPALRSCLDIGSMIFTQEWKQECKIPELYSLLTETTETYLCRMANTLKIFGNRDWTTCTVRSIEDCKRFEECLKLNVTKHTEKISVAYVVLLDNWLLQASSKLPKLRCINMLSQDHEKPILSISLTSQELLSIGRTIRAIQSMSSDQPQPPTFQGVYLLNDCALKFTTKCLSQLRNITTLHIGWEPSLEYGSAVNAYITIWKLPALRSLGLYLSPRKFSEKSNFEEYVMLCDAILQGPGAEQCLEEVVLHGFITSNTMPIFMGRLENTLVSCELDQIGFHNIASWEETEKLIQNAERLRSVTLNTMFSSACVLESPPEKSAWIAVVGNFQKPFQLSRRTLPESNIWRTRTSQFSYQYCSEKHKPYLQWWHNNTEKITFALF